MSIKKNPCHPVPSCRRGRRPRWELRVYVANTDTRSSLTIANLERLCQERVPGQYRIRIIDLFRSPDRSRADQIVAVPTVVRALPLPERRVIGTLADSQKAAAGLELGLVQ